MIYQSLPRSRHARKAGPGRRHRDGHKTPKNRPPTLRDELLRAMLLGIPAPAEPFTQHTNQERNLARAWNRRDTVYAKRRGTKAANRHYSMTAMTGW